MSTRHRGQPLICHGGPSPEARGLRILITHILIRAAKDATGRDPREQDEALDWLNSEEGRDIAQALGVHWTGDITAEDLRTRERYVYFRGD